MKRCTLNIFLLLSLLAPLAAQPATPAEATRATSSKDDPSPIPTVVKFSGTIRELDGSVRPGPRGIVFSLYQDDNGGVPFWAEAQSVTVDSQGRFTALLGLVNSGGVPADMFVSGKSRWVGVSVTPDDGMVRARVQLTTVPYAFKAADADKLGGMGADEFVSQEQLSLLLKKQPPAMPSVATEPPILELAKERPRWWPIELAPVARAPKFEATSPSGPSFVSDAASGPPFLVKSRTLVLNLNSELLHGLAASAFAKLTGPNVFSAVQNLSGGMNLPAAAKQADMPGVFDSSSLDFESLAPDPTTNAPLSRRFRWISQPLFGATSEPSASLSLLFGVNGATPAKTGLFINSDGTINFAPGQRLPSEAVVSALSGDQGGGSSGGIPTVYTVQYSWAQPQKTVTAIAVGANEITLTPCPRGVNGTDVWHYLYISGTGTPEVVLISGGSCTSGAASGTIQFAANFPHPSGYTISTATDGVQEAVNDAVVPGTNGQTSREVLISPGSHIFRARLSIRRSSIRIRASGATVNCVMTDTCIMMGDPADSNQFVRITLIGLRLSAGVPGGTWPAVEDNANGSEIDDLGPAASPIPGGSFGSMIQVDNDQAATINRLDTNLAPWARCDTSFCSTGIVGPGPFSKNAGVIWVKDSNLSLQCKANGIDNQNGNTLNVSNSVIQAYPQFGVRSRRTFAAPTVQLTGVYTEVGNCTNPLGLGEAGLIVLGGQATVSSTVGPAGVLPQFANTGTIQYRYYVVVHSSTLGTSATAYLAGYASTSGSGPVNVRWYQIGTVGDITYDLLRVKGDGGVGTIAPFGPGPFAVATGLPATACSNRVCSFVDDAASVPSSYTVTNGQYWPALWMWPGSVILTTAFDVQNVGGSVPTRLFIDSLGSSAFGGVVVSAGGSQPSVFAQSCDPQGSWSSIWMQCLGGSAESNDYPPVTGTVLQLTSAGGTLGKLKGRLIFELPNFNYSSVAGTHVLTLADSNPDKTLATPNNRPGWDANDTYIGYDQPKNVLVAETQLSFGAPVSISNYIANPGDGVNFLERLTSSLKVFKVPVQVSQVRTGSASNTDAAGMIAISDGISGSYSFAGTYTAAPSCTLTPLSDPSAIGAYWATITNTALIVHTKLSGSVSFDYHCWAH
jgi:hypothetical protein